MVCALLLVLAGCAAVLPLPPDRPVATTIAVVERGWHTDICVRGADAGPWLLDLAHRFPGARFLCFGFGERQYIVSHDHGPLAMLSAMLPSRAALLMTALRDPPAAAFGAGNVVTLGISRAGLASLLAFLRRATETGAAGEPISLGDGPYQGSEYFAATGTYSGLFTCNTWTATALQAAGVTVGNAVLFSGDVMRQARRAAAGQPGGDPSSTD